MLENISGVVAGALTADEDDGDGIGGEPQKAGDRAYEQLRQLIVSLKIEPGLTVDELSLSKKLGIGRTPIREALQRLAAESLVIIIPRRGTRIAPIDLGELKEVEDLRWTLETLAARWAATRIGERELEALEHLIDQAESGELSATEDWDVEVDRRFHSTVAAAGQNRYLARELSHLYNLSIRLQYALRTQIASVGEELFDYRRIIAALRAQDPDAAEEGMREHLIDTRDRIAAGLGSTVGQFYQDGD